MECLKFTLPLKAVTGKGVLEKPLPSHLARPRAEPNAAVSFWRSVLKKMGFCQNPGAETRSGNRVWLAAPSSRRWVPPHLPPPSPPVPSCPPRPCCQRSPPSIPATPWLPAPRPSLPAAPSSPRNTFLLCLFFPTLWKTQPGGSSGALGHRAGCSVCHCCHRGERWHCHQPRLWQLEGAGDGAVPAVPAAPSPPRGFAGVSDCVSILSLLHSQLLWVLVPVPALVTVTAPRWGKRHLERGAASPERPLCHRPPLVALAVALTGA